MSTQNKSITNIRLKANKTSRGLSQKTPIKVSQRLTPILELKMGKIEKAITRKAYPGYMNWEAEKIFSNKQKWEDFLRESLTENKIFREKESEELVFKYDTKPKIKMNFGEHFETKFNFRVWKKSDKKNTMYDIRTNFVAQHVPASPGNAIRQHHINLSLIYKSAAKVTVDNLKAEKKNNTPKAVPLEKQLPQETLKKIEELDKAFANNNHMIKLDSYPPKNLYTAYDSAGLLNNWLKNEVFINPHAIIKRQRTDVSFIREENSKSVYKFNVYQLYQKKKTLRSVEVTFSVDLNEDFNQNIPSYYRKGVFTITGWDKVQ